MDGILGFIGLVSIILVIGSLAMIANHFDEIMEFIYRRKVNKYEHEIEIINLQIKQEQIQSERIRLELELTDKKLKLQK